MKLIVHESEGLELLRPSRRTRKVVAEVMEPSDPDSKLMLKFDWRVARVPGKDRQQYPLSVRVPQGAYLLERRENPFIHGGEPWLVLKGTQIGAAEARLRQMAAVME
jgi:hypothetical protein